MPVVIDFALGRSKPERGHAVCSLAFADLVEFWISDRLSWLSQVAGEALPDCFGPASNLRPSLSKKLRPPFRQAR